MVIEKFILTYPMLAASDGHGKLFQHTQCLQFLIVIEKFISTYPVLAASDGQGKIYFNIENKNSTYNSIDSFDIY